MTAPPNHNPGKKSAEGELKSVDVAPCPKDPRRPNPVWQSLAVRSGIVQAKLTVGKADDPYEREADRVADQVMRMLAPQSNGLGLSITPANAPQAQRTCAECEEEEEKGSLQRKEIGSPEATVIAPQIVDQTLSSPGQPLDATTRAYFEPRFGHDFSGVRIHTGGDAASATHAVRARAFTVANQIAFAAGQYEPHSETGRQLLAHELTHVAQQERIEQRRERMLLQREPIAGDKDCIEPPPLDIATVDYPLAEGILDRRGALIRTMRLWKFERNEDTLNDYHFAALNQLVSESDEFVRGNPEILGWSVTSIVGHASPEGDENYNVELALRRAEAVFSALGVIVSESKALPASVSSGKECGEEAPSSEYPYFRAVDVTVEFFSESLPEHVQESSELAKVVQVGDVVVRGSGILGVINPWVTIIGERYNHGGVAIDETSIHHIESNGYETTTVEAFFDPDIAIAGAILRFQGPFASEIRARVAEIAMSRRYVRIPGNPWSSAEDLETLNCNEFVHEVYRQAITELMAEAQQENPEVFQQLLAEYGDSEQANQVKNLIQATTLQSQNPSAQNLLNIEAIELAGKLSLTEEAAEQGAMVSEFEGDIKVWNIYPEEWATSDDPTKFEMYQHGWYSSYVVRTYTPDSFVNSKYFTLVGRVETGKLEKPKEPEQSGSKPTGREAP